MADAVEHLRNIPNLSELGVITPSYEHYEKVATPGAGLRLPGAYLKWYEIRRPHVEMPPALIRESREFLQTETASGRLRLHNQLGFVELHHCTSVAFLLVFTWNNDNEMWQTVYIKDLVNDGAYQLFDVADGCHRTICCVWELAPVWHERQARARYLRSARDEEAKYVYLADHFSGTC
ncbi:MAG TPA: hypothetical protein VFQ25_00110 [Ktedonobacterales bacterium]|nr:hypothetical protein [Ktedonobacterales bacterium]